MTQKERDTIDNALLIGMSLEDAYIYAGVTPSVIASLAEDDEWQRHVAKRRKEHEFSLLRRLDDVQEKQVRMGKEGAITWALEHMYPARYANKQQGDGKVVQVVITDGNPSAEDTVEIHE